MYGNLFKYDSKNDLIAFESGCLSSNRCFIFLGGLSEGPLTLAYMESLSSTLANLPIPYSLIQPVLRSSWMQFGWRSIDTDVEDLKLLIDYLVRDRPNLESLVLMGHSTGCQDLIHYLRQGKPPSFVHRVILQAPVSDRQYFATLPTAKDTLDYCAAHAQDKKEWLPRSLQDLPMTIERCLSLNERNSIEDLFSSDLTDEELNRIYEKIETPITWIWSKKDKYVPDKIKEEVYYFVKEKLATKTSDTFLALENADHDIDEPEEQKHMLEHISHVISLIRKQ